MTLVQDPGEVTSPTKIIRKSLGKKKTTIAETNMGKNPYADEMTTVYSLEEIHKILCNLHVCHLFLRPTVSDPRPAFSPSRVVSAKTTSTAPFKKRSGVLREHDYHLCVSIFKQDFITEY